MFTCPASIPDVRTGCPGADLTAITVACTSATFGTNPSPPPRPTSRATIQIGVNSTLNSVIVPIGPTLPCGPNGLPPNGVTVTFGLDYISDFAPPVVGAPFCILRSKASFPQWGISDPLVAIAFDGVLKERLFLAFDQQVVDRLNSTVGIAPGSTPRCPTWRQLP